MTGSLPQCRCAWCMGRCACMLQEIYDLPQVPGHRQWHAAVPVFVLPPAPAELSQPPPLCPRTMHQCIPVPRRHLEFFPLSRKRARGRPCPDCGTRHERPASGATARYMIARAELCCDRRCLSWLTHAHPGSAHTCRPSIACAGKSCCHSSPPWIACADT